MKTIKGYEFDNETKGKDMENILEVENYKGFIIDRGMDGHGFTVCIDGDEWYFETVDDARNAIDEYIESADESLDIDDINYIAYLL